MKRSFLPGKDCRRASIYTGFLCLIRDICKPRQTALLRPAEYLCPVPAGFGSAHLCYMPVHDIF